MNKVSEDDNRAGDHDLSGSDRTLVSRIQSGDPRAFHTLMKQYLKPLVNFAHFYVKSSSDAKDIVQDVFARVWENREDWNPTRSLRLFLYQSVKHRALNHLRDQKTEQMYLEAYFNELETNPTENIQLDKNGDDMTDFRSAVQNAIEELPERAKRVYKLHRRDGLTYREIAEIMQISQKTVESQMSRALKKLRDCLAIYLPTLFLMISLVQVS